MDYFKLFNDACGIGTRLKGESDWVRIRYEKCLDEYQKVMWLDFEPTEAFIETIYAPKNFNSGKHHTVKKDDESGLWILTLRGAYDSSD